MPPRLRTPSASLATDAFACAPCARAPFARSFTTTPCREKMSRARQQMYQWINSRDGRELAEVAAGRGTWGRSPTSRSRRTPVPQPAGAGRADARAHLGEGDAARRGAQGGLGGDGRRREESGCRGSVEGGGEAMGQRQTQGNKLATPYAKAVMSMLPKTSYREGEQNTPHEPVNEVHVHKLTMQQLFVPVSESRRFTREDAAKAFHETMLSADKRSPQPELIKMEREILEGKRSREEGMERFKEATQREEDAVARRIVKQQEEEERRTTRVHTDRYEFRFKEVSVNDAGRDGRSRKGTGWRYGAPFDDRKRGVVKIPTSVP
ncbi:hypothetical protein ACCO45_009619 [Purpureocillium lilacinum]|uniref:Uncharacterized protein n=1 Tax=Purpureocillium lilacinum TaxID=33203 RepID=A0ACC4DL00_PURLI